MALSMNLQYLTLLTCESLAGRKHAERHQEWGYLNPVIPVVFGVIVIQQLLRVGSGHTLKIGLERVAAIPPHNGVRVVLINGLFLTHRP